MNDRLDSIIDRLEALTAELKDFRDLNDCCDPDCSYCNPQEYIPEDTPEYCAYRPCQFNSQRVPMRERDGEYWCPNHY